MKQGYKRLNHFSDRDLLRATNAYLQLYPDKRINNYANNRYIEPLSKRFPTKGYEGCAQWVDAKIRNALGYRLATKSGIGDDAWKLPMKIVNHGGEEIYNIYTPQLKKQINTKNVNQKVDSALASNPLDYSKLQIGDVVGINLPGSNYDKTAINTGTTYNTHVGIVEDFKNGMPIIGHNIHEKYHRDRIDNIAGSRLGRGKSKVAVVARLAPLVNRPSIEMVRKPSKYYYEGQNSDMASYMDGSESSKEYLSSLFPNVPLDTVQKIAAGVQQRETGLLANKESDQLKKNLIGSFINLNPLDMAKKRISLAVAGAKKIYRDWIKRVPEEDVSTNMGKMKMSSFTDAELKSLNIHSRDDLEDPYKAGAAATYMLAKNYDYFQRLQKAYPDLGITDDDIINMTALSYNQGMSKLDNVGFDHITGKAAPEELKAIRAMNTNKKIKDISSTNYKHIPFGELLYNFVDGNTSYVYSARQSMNKIKERTPEELKRATAIYSKKYPRPKKAATNAQIQAEQKAFMDSIAAGKNPIFRPRNRVYFGFPIKNNNSLLNRLNLEEI